MLCWELQVTALRGSPVHFLQDVLSILIGCVYLLFPIYSFTFTCYVLYKFAHLKEKKHKAIIDHSSRLDRT